MKQWRVVLIIVLLIVVVVFAIQNTNLVAVDVVFQTFDVPLVLVILICILIGAIIGMITSLGSIQSNRKKVKNLEKDIANLKNTHTAEIVDRDRQIAQLRQEVDTKDRQLRNSTSFTADEAQLSVETDGLSE